MPPHATPPTPSRVVTRRTHTGRHTRRMIQFAKIRCRMFGPPKYFRVFYDSPLVVRCKMKMLPLLAFGEYVGKQGPADSVAQTATHTDTTDTDNDTPFPTIQIDRQQRNFQQYAQRQQYTQRHTQTTAQRLASQCANTRTRKRTNARSLEWSGFGSKKQDGGLGHNYIGHNSI